MTAVSSADRYDGKPARGNSVTEGSAAASGVASARASVVLRPLEQILPPQKDSSRGGQMQEGWEAFFDQKGMAVRDLLDGGSPPSDIAHALTDMVRDHFYASGVTLTGYELRRLVIELLELHSRARRAWLPPSPEGPVPIASPEAAMPAPSLGDSASVAESNVSESAVEAPPSSPGNPPIEEAAAPRAAAACAEASGTQDPIERLWADRWVDAILVHGPRAVFVERNGAIELSAEVFRDDVHLSEIAAELVRRWSPAGQPASPIASFHMDDGAVGTVIFPPAAPRGPVIVVHRHEAAIMTFERLVARGAMSQAMADLLCIAVRCRLNILVSGPPSATAGWLGAVGRAGEAATRIVSVARERDFRWTAPGGVELIVPPSNESEVRYASLIAAGARLRPDLLLLKEISDADMPALFDRLSRGDRGIAASVMPGPILPGLEAAFDLSLRVDRGADGACRALVLQDASGAAVFVHEQGRFVRQAGDPAFAGALHAAGYREALLTILR